LYCFWHAESSSESNSCRRLQIKNLSVFFSFWIFLIFFKRLACALFNTRIRTAAFSIICSLVLVEPAAAGGAATRAAEQSSDMAVVFMVLFLAVIFTP